MGLSPHCINLAVYLCCFFLHIVNHGTPDTVFGTPYEPFGASSDLANNDDTVEITTSDSVGLPDEGVAAPLTIGPEEVYETPQRVWLPLPDSIDADAVKLYYYHTNENGRGWYPAENVEGWLVPGSRLYLEVEDTRYLGFLVRHAGIVQLGIPQE